jgi:hypothetical protein
VRELDVALHNQPPKPDPWFGTAVYNPDKGDVPRRSHPDPAADLPPDAAELDPTILPVRRNGWRS